MDAPVPVWCGGFLKGLHIKTTLPDEPPSDRVKSKLGKILYGKPKGFLGYIIQRIRCAFKM